MRIPVESGTERRSKSHPCPPRAGESAGSIDPFTLLLVYTPRSTNLSPQMQYQCTFFVLLPSNVAGNVLYFSTVLQQYILIILKVMLACPLGVSVFSIYVPLEGTVLQFCLVGRQILHVQQVQEGAQKVQMRSDFFLYTSTRVYPPYRRLVPMEVNPCYDDSLLRCTLCRECSTCSAVFLAGCAETAVSYMCL